MAVRDEHELDRKVEKLLAQGFPQLVVSQAGLQISQPTGRAEAQAALVLPEEAVAGDERRELRKPDHGLARARNPNRLDPRG